MRISRSVILPLAVLAGVVASAGEARGQSCWPAMVGLVVRDSAGAVIEPAALDSVEYAPLPGPTPDFSVEPRILHPAGSGEGGVAALAWTALGRCRVTIDQVVIRHAGHEMRLRMKVRVDTQKRSGRSSWVIDLPPLQSATFELEWSGSDGGGGHDSAPAPIPASRWRRLPSER